MVDWWRGRGLLADMVAVSLEMEPHTTALFHGPWGQPEGSERKSIENRVTADQASWDFPPAPSKSLWKIQGLESRDPGMRTPEPSADTWGSPSLWRPKPCRLQCAGCAPGLPVRVVLPEACQVNLLLPGPGPEKPPLGFQVGPDISSPGLMVYKNSSKKLEAVTPKLSRVTENHDL